MKDILNKAQEEIDIFDRPSKATSVELMQEVFTLRGERTSLKGRIGSLENAINRMQTLCDGEAWDIAEDILYE